MTRSIVALAALAALIGCQSDKPTGDQATANKSAPASKSSTAKAPATQSPDASWRAIFKALPAEMPSEINPITPAKIDLGRMLYFEKRLSKNHDISCNSCHDLAQFGVDNKPTSPGHKGQLGGRNSPTVYNAAGHIAQFWDGRAADVEAQAKGPVLNPIEMGMPSEAYVLTVLKSMPEYVAAFKAAFPKAADAVTFDNFALAVGAFERKLVTPSRFDTYLKGDDKALTDAERAGLKLFVETGCVACHNGAYVGGAMYQKLGLVKPWPNLTDKGRGAQTKNAAEDYMFKVPSLRNIAKTGPYLHDGSVAKLGEMVKLMAAHQSGRTLSDGDTASIVTFLGSLTGTAPADYIKAPTLPPSTDATPKPDPT